MDDESFNLAVVGAGMASAPHLASLLELQDRVTVRHVVARSLDRARAIAQRLPHAQAGVDLDRVLSEGQVEGVLLLTPPDTHLALGTKIADAGKHLLVEKPIDVTTHKACELVAICQHRGIVAAAVLQHRVRAASVRLRRLIEEGVLGSIYSASVAVPWWRPQSYYDEPGRGTSARDGGGVLMTQAIHTLDLFLWLLRRPVQVFAYAMTSPAHRMECEDTVVGAMKFDHGCVASIYASTATFPGFAERIELSGTGGTAVLSAGKLQVNLSNGTRIEQGEEEALGAGANPMDFSHGAHKAVLANFVDAARRSCEPIAPLSSALDVHLLIDALIQSSRSNAPTRLSPPNLLRTS